MYLYVCEKMRNPAWESIIKHIVLPGCLMSFSCAVLPFFAIVLCMFSFISTSLDITGEKFLLAKFLECQSPIKFN